MKPDQSKDKQISELYLSGLSTPKISKLLKESEYKILSSLKRSNTPIRTPDKRRRLYKVNEDYFKNIDTPEKAYWLGFIYADGCVYDNRRFFFSLWTIDEYALDQFLIDSGCESKKYYITSQKNIRFQKWLELAFHL